MNESFIRAQNAMFGTGAQLKEQALEVILEETSGAQRVEFYRPTVSVPPGFGILDDVIAATPSRN